MMRVPGLPQKRSLRQRARRRLSRRRPIAGAAVLDPTWRAPVAEPAPAEAHVTAEFPAIGDPAELLLPVAVASAAARQVAGDDSDVVGDSALATATVAAEPGLSRRLRLPRPGSGRSGDEPADPPLRPIDRSFDLLTRERERSGRRLRLPVRPIEIGAGAAVVLALVVIAAGQRSADGQLADARAENTALGERLGALEQQLAGSQAVDPSQRLAAEETLARAGALNEALTGRIPWDLTLTDLARVLPAGAWLTSLSTSEPEGDSLAPALVVTGFAREQGDVVDVLGRLEVLREVAAVRLQSSSATLIEETPVIQFTVEVEVEAA